MIPSKIGRNLRADQKWKVMFHTHGQKKTTMMVFENACSKRSVNKYQQTEHNNRDGQVDLLDSLPLYL